MTKTLLAVLLLSLSAIAQTPIVQQPDCTIVFPNLTAVNATAPAAAAGGAFSNLNTACDTWNMSFSISGFSSVTVALQSAPNNAGTPGTWVTYAGQTLIQGSNPSTITADGSFTWLTGYNPWVRVILTAATGSGTVSGAAFGWRIPSASTSGGTSTTSNVNIQKFGGTSVAIGQAAMAASMPVVVASNQSAVPVSISSPLGQVAMAASVPVVVASNQTNLPENLVQIGGATYALGQAAMAASAPVVIASNQATFPVTVATSTTGADGFLNTSLGLVSTSLMGINGPYGFNGTSWDRERNASLSNFPTSQTTTARNSIGAQIHEHGSRWSVISNPAAGSQATASIANETGVRHVADCITFSAVATTAPSLTALTVNLRDGATGAGTIIATWQVAVAATTGQDVPPFGMCGLNLVGTTNTAMTLEFSASLANLIESVTITGYNVN